MGRRKVGLALAVQPVGRRDFLKPDDDNNDDDKVQAATANLDGYR